MTGNNKTHAIIRNLNKTAIDDQFFKHIRSVFQDYQMVVKKSIHLGGSLFLHLCIHNVFLIREVCSSNC